MASFPLAELNISKELFTPSLSGNDISLLSDLSNRKLYFNFQDAVFKDYAWNKAGNASDIIWTLNFKGTSISSPKETKNYTIELILKLFTKGDNTSTFKINSISIN